MKQTLRLAAIGTIGLGTLSAGLLAQPILTPPGTPAAAGEAAKAPPAADTVYVIKSEEATRDEAPNQAQIDGRHAALEQFRLGDQAFRRGQTQEATAYYAGLKNNPHLSPAERLQVVRLCEQLERKDARRASALQNTRMEQPGGRPANPDDVLAEARQAFSMKDYDRAEALAAHSRQLGHSIFFPWSDTPAKLLRDVQEARRQAMTTATAPRPASTYTKGERGGGTQVTQSPQASFPISKAGPGGIVMNSLPTGQTRMPPPPRADEPGRAIEQARHVEPRPTATTGQPGAATVVYDSPPIQEPRQVVRTQADPLAQRAATARTLLEQAHLHVEAGDLAGARQLVKQAEALRITLPWWEDFTPEKLRLEITRAELAPKSKATESQAVVQASGPSKPVGQPASKSAAPGSRPETAGPDPRVFVAEARKQLNAGQLDRAVDLVKQAQLTPGVRWGHFEDSPERILNDVAKARQEFSDQKATELLAESRQLLVQGRFEDAERLTYQAEALRAEYPVLYRGERHDRLRAEIVAKRQAQNKTPLPPLLDPLKTSAALANKPSAQLASQKPAPVESPWKLLAPRKPESEIIASAPPLVGPGGLKRTTPGERPSAIPGPAEVIARSDARRDSARGAATRPEHQGRRLDAQAGHTESFKPLAPAPDIDFNSSAGQGGKSDTQRPDESLAADPAKRASAHLGDARQHHKEGLLLEALAAWLHAKNAHATPGPQDDVTDELLARFHAELHRDAQAQVVAFSAAVQTLTTKGHYRDAERYLKYMQTLAAAFEIDPKALGEDAAHAHPSKLDSHVVQAAAQGAPALLPGDERGQELFADARRELRLANYFKARRLAEALYLGPYSFRSQAKDLLAEIDEAEFNESVRKAQAQYDLAAQAYVRRDYHGASFYLHGLDTRLLNDQAKDHVREILASQELQQRQYGPGASSGAPVNVTVIVTTPGAEPVVIVPDAAKRPAMPKR